MDRKGKLMSPGLRSFVTPQKWGSVRRQHMQTCVAYSLYNALLERVSGFLFYFTSSAQKRSNFLGFAVYKGKASRVLHGDKGKRREITSRYESKGIFC